MKIRLALVILLFLPVCSKEDTDKLPDRVYFRTATESFNRVYYTAVRDGGIWIKHNTEITGIDDKWSKLELPEDLEGNVTEISMDDEHILALNREREVYTMWSALDEISGFTWQKEWGFPYWGGPGIRLPESLLAWSFSVVSLHEDVQYIDPAGNSLPIGSEKCSHIIMLFEGGQKIIFNDPWLPVDFSYEIPGPMRGKFRAVNMSASGSTAFIINKYGDMFTRIYDFDISGCNNYYKFSKPPVNYSYFNQKGIENYDIQLPTFPWVLHPKINGKITDRISISKKGVNVVNRTMRVEGRNSDGDTGFYEKDITEMESSNWKFVKTGGKLKGTVLEKKDYDSSAESAGESEDRYYSRNMDAVPSLGDALVNPDEISDAEWAAELLDFNCYQTPAVLRVHVKQGVYYDIELHIIDQIRSNARENGLDDIPRFMTGTIGVSPELPGFLAGAHLKFQKFAEKYLYVQGDESYTTVEVKATLGSVVINHISGSVLYKDPLDIDYTWTFSSK